MSNKYDYSLKSRSQLTSEYKISQNRKPEKTKQNLSGKIPWNSSVRINSRPSELKSPKHLKVKLNAPLNSSDKRQRQVSAFSTYHTQKSSYLTDIRNIMTENSNSDNLSSHFSVSCHFMGRSKSNEGMSNGGSGTCACQCYVRYNDMLEIYAWYLRLRTIMEHRFSLQQLHTNNEVYMHRTITEYLNQLEVLLNKTLPDELRPSISTNCPIISSQQNYSSDMPPQSTVIQSKQVVPTTILQNLIERDIHRICQQKHSVDIHYEKNNNDPSADNCCFQTSRENMRERKKDSLKEQSGAHANKISFTKEHVDSWTYQSTCTNTGSLTEKVIQIVSKVDPPLDCPSSTGPQMLKNNKTSELNRLYRNSMLLEQENSYKDNTPFACYTTSEVPYSIDRALTEYIKAKYLDFSAANVPALDKLGEMEQPEYSITSRKSSLERNLMTQIKQLKIGVVYTKLYSILQDMNYYKINISVSCVINALGLARHNNYFQVSNNLINIRYIRNNEVYETKIVVQSVLPHNEDFEPTILVKAVLLRRKHDSIYTAQPMLDKTARPEGDVMPIFGCNCPLLEMSIEKSSTIKASKMGLKDSLQLEPFLFFARMPETNEKQNKTVFSQMSTDRKYGATYLLWRLADQLNNLKKS